MGAVCDFPSSHFSTLMTKRQPSWAQSGQACPTHLSDEVPMVGWWKCAESQRDWCAIIQSERQATLKCMRQNYEYLASFYKKCRVSRPLFKNRKHTVDAGKMWPDCNGRLSYFNLKAVFTFSVTYFDLWWIANQVPLLHVLNLPNTSKPHLLWRLRLTSKQSLGTGLPLTT